MIYPTAPPPFVAASGIATDTLIVGAIAGAALVGVLVLTGILLRSRRQQLVEVRRIVRALEEVRSGNPVESPTVAPGSSLALVSDAVGRLGEELGEQWRRVGIEQKRLQSVLEAAETTAVVTTGSTGDIETFSRGAGLLLGWEEDEVVGRPVQRLFEEAAYKDLLPKLARRELRERGLACRTTLVRQDGSHFAADLQVRMVRDADGRPAGFLLSVNDATHQAKLEEELRESEQRYRGLVDGLGDGVAIVKGGRVEFSNPSFAAMFGVRPSALHGRAMRELVSTRDLILVEEYVATVEAGSQPAKEEISARLVDSDGAPVADVRLLASRIDTAGRAAVLLLVRDETAELRIQQELQRNETRLDAVLESTTDGILMLADAPEGGSVQLTNQALAQMIGLDVGALLGASESQLRVLLTERGAGVERIAELLFASVGGRRTERIELDGQRPRLIEVVVAPLVGGEGRRLGRILACRDLTERRRAERRLEGFAEEAQLSKARLEQAYAELDRANRDLAARRDELDRLNAELVTLNEMKSTLLANVSHELQTPLVSVRGYTEMILRGRLGQVNDEQRNALDRSLRSVDRMISMIDGLLSFARNEQESARLDLTDFEIQALVDEVQGDVSGELEARGLEFSSTVEPGLVAHADREKILQVLLNLVSNAIKFNRERGSVRVQATAGSAERILVEVSDTGIGIPAPELDRVFDRGFRVEDSPEPGRGGAGLGLAIVRDILRLHGCRIYSPQSAPGSGTTFRFELPRSSAGAETDAGFGGAEPGGDAGGAGGGEPEAHPEPEPERDTEQEREPEEGNGTENGDSRPRFKILRPE